MKKKTRLAADAQKTIMILLLAAVLLSISPRVYAEETKEVIQQPLLENLSFSVDGAEPVIVRTIHYDYRNNRFVSLRDFASALNGTARSFGLCIEDGQTLLTTGSAYIPAGGENQPFPDTDAATGAPYIYTTSPLALHPVWLDGRLLHYLSFLGTNSASEPDCFISLTDLSMFLDLYLEVSSGKMTLDTNRGFYIDLDRLRGEGFFYEIYSALIGDADTGEIYDAWEPQLAVPIASTTKLMTYIVLMDAVADGTVSLEDTVTITEEAARLSRTEDGEIPMQAGVDSNVTDLLYGMLLPSSNESALSLAIHTAGSEEAFVKRMNQKAAELGLSEAVFYNCHGLPLYTDNLPATKIQNRMTASDMFKLIIYLLKTYPDITNITSTQTADLESLNITVNNTNPLLYNVPGVVGLKTGTTDMSGDCLVTAMEAENAEGETHRLIVIEFGAEDNTIRTTISEELVRYALQRLRQE